jgi:tetratricopeptide (TPR) repeat protein
LSDSKQKKDDATGEKPSADTGGRFARSLGSLPGLGGLHKWSNGHWSRRVVVGVGILAIIGGTITAWAYLARVALESGQIPLSVALNALDRGQPEQARNLVSRMLTSGILPKSEYGGPLFVLGAIKTYDAETDPTPEKRRVDYLVASRYLKEARAYGFPPGREEAGIYLLGKSLLESNQFEEGIAILDEALESAKADSEPMTWSIHRLLANACLWMPNADLEKALSHSKKALESTQLAPNDRADVLIDQALCLSRMAQFDEAYKSLDAIPADADRRVYTLLARAQLTLEELEATLQKTAVEEQSNAVAKAAPKVDAAIHGLDEAAAGAGEDGRVTRRIGYLRAEGYRLMGDIEAALREFTVVRQFHDDTPEGTAAGLLEAELNRLRGDYPAALLGYRRVLESINPTTYRGYVMPLSKFRAAAMAALTDYVQRQRFDDARVILARFSPLFTQTEELNFRGEMFQAWGETLLGAVPDDAWHPDENREKGLLLLREAGMAYEQLAELRFATEAYTDDLWSAAENYYRGHSFTRATLALNKFLGYEPELRNAQALLRLGQCHLALGKIDQSIAALEECIEFHPQDSATYQARIDCAKALWYKGNVERAEQLLRENIAGSKLKPASREWKDSLFELGMLLYDNGAHEQAIATLEEAIERYPDDPQTLLAQYVIGVSYRSWAEAEQDAIQSARSTSEREKSSKLTTERLQRALDNLLAVQRSITQDLRRDPIRGAMLRNCYMLAGTVLFDLERYNDAINAYSNLSSLYPNDPFVLETFVQIANCYRRLGQIDKAQGAIQQAQIAFDGLPADADFESSTARKREEWQLLLRDMADW